MTEYVVGRLDDIPQDGAVAVQAGRHLVAVFRVGDAVYALHNTCPHKGGFLCQGQVVADKKMVRCPWHYWNWSLETGALETDPRQKVRRFEVKVVDGEVVLTA
ncbi:MAG: nitrite reductase small subunit NirD [Alphaproteobacteria bacterium]|nr:nitrite reductase small subunit NirD [Alphaproteobacteria bacterium]